MLQACSSPSRLDAVPAGRATHAVIPGIPEARAYADGGPEYFQRHGLASFQREQAHLKAQGHAGPQPPVHYLAISGGGDNGAFGAGLLVGWTEAGDRPEFKLVTGISTGALIAPFAFLGPEYDAQLQKVYTSISPEDIYESRPFLEIIFSDAAADNAPLLSLVRQLANQDMLDSIAAEYAKGRLLLIATTDLDARRPVIWNIGEIAMSGHPNAVGLFQNILVASASIPGAFPPIMFNVEVDGTPYQEMHVDGGAMAQTFVYPPSISIAKLSKKGVAQRERHLYIIRNARLDPDWASVERHIFSIAGRAIASLTHTQGIGDLYRMYLQAERDGVDYNLAFIPSDFTLVHEEEFDTEYMRQLFDHAYQLSKAGYRWEKHPPGFDTTE
jgi:hypothetical protein